MQLTPHKRKAVRPLVIDLGLYPIEVQFTLTKEAFLAATEALEDAVDVEWLDGSAGMCRNALDGHGVVLVGVFDWKVGTLVHELYHASLAIQEYLGIMLDGENNEAGAYLIGYLTELCYAHMAKSAPKLK